MRSYHATRRFSPALIFPQPQAGNLKWWAVEVRFDRPLLPSEYKVFERAYGAGWGNTGDIGADGAVWRQWWNSYPHEADAEGLEAVLRRIDVPGVIRAAPFGRDCIPKACLSAFDFKRCKLGRPEACDPVFTSADWIGFDFREVPHVCP